MSEEHPHQQPRREGNREDTEGRIGNKGIRKKRKTETIGMIFAKENKNKSDKATNLPRQKIKDAVFMKDKARNIGLGPQDEECLTKRCQEKGEIYPSEQVHNMFKRTMEGRRRQEVCGLKEGIRLKEG